MTHDKTDTTTKLRRGIARMLRPIARICVKNSLVLQDLIEIAKGAMVEAAQQEIEQSGHRANVSRVSVLSGVHRKDINRLQSKHAPSLPPPSLMSRVIGQWEQDLRFQNQRGQPRALRHDGSEFTELIECVSSDVNAGTVLFELERLGLVERSGDLVKLIKRSVIIEDDILGGLQILAADSDDLGSAVLQNIQKDVTPKNLHARTEYDNIAEEDLPKIRAWLLNEGALFHERARKFIAQFDRDVHAQSKAKEGATPPRAVERHSVVLGTFSVTKPSAITEQELP